MKLHVFSDYSNGDASFRVVDTVHHFFPFRKVNGPLWKGEKLYCNLIQSFLVEHKRGFVKYRYCLVFYDTLPLHVTEQGDLLLYGLLDGLVASHDYDVWEDTSVHQLLHGVLGRLGFMLS